MKRDVRLRPPNIQFKSVAMVAGKSSTSPSKSKPKAKAAPTGTKPKAKPSPKVPKPDAPKHVDVAELGKAAMCSDSLNTAEFDTFFQMPSIVKRSRLSMLPKRRCQRRAQMLRWQNLRKKIEIRLSQRQARSPARSLPLVVTSPNCSAGLVPCPRCASKWAVPLLSASLLTFPIHGLTQPSSWAGTNQE